MPYSALCSSFEIITRQLDWSRKRLIDIAPWQGKGLTLGFWPLILSWRVSLPVPLVVWCKMFVLRPAVPCSLDGLVILHFSKGPKVKIFSLSFSESQRDTICVVHFTPPPSWFRIC